MLPWLLRFGALIGVLLVLAPALHRGWTHVETDFPNYYTAAVLARKHAPLRKFYDWTWFQRQMNYAGWERQLGGYIPHSPLTMLPMLPLSGMAPMTAKRVWLAANVAFLLAAVWLLSSMSTLPASGFLLLAAAGYQSLSLNFIYGQYYVFILFLLAASVWLLLRGRDVWSGALLGLIFLLKLYAGPFLLYFAWKRQWRALSGMLAACIALGLFSIGLFGWKDNLYYVTSVLPRALGGESTDPYAPGLATVSNMLRHAFVFEPELNPHPLANVPAVAFFLQALVTLAAPLMCLLAIPRSRDQDKRRELAWFIVMLLFVSPSRVQYMGVMLLVPVALLWDKATLRSRFVLVSLYLLLTVPMPGALIGCFPTLWILLACYLALGAPYLRNLRPAVAAIAATAIVLAASLSAYLRMASFRTESPQHFARVAVRADAIYSASPALSSDGLFYESMGRQRYELQHWRGDKLETFLFDGEALHPSVPRAGGAVYFELVSHGHSQIMRYEPATKPPRTVVSSAFNPTHPAVSPDGQKVAFLTEDRIAIYSGGSINAIDVPGTVNDVAWFPDSQRLVCSAGPLGSAQIYATIPPSGAPVQLTRDPGDHTEPAISPDGRWLASTLERGGTRQIWIQDMASGQTKQVTHGNCNSYSAAWEPDSRGFVFASDCERGQGLPALYRWNLEPSFPQATSRN